MIEIVRRLCVFKIDRMRDVWSMAQKRLPQRPLLRYLDLGFCVLDGVNGLIVCDR